jgi:hypothetical protein
MEDEQTNYGWLPVNRQTALCLPHPSIWSLEIVTKGLYDDSDNAVSLYGYYCPYEGWSLATNWTNTAYERNHFRARLPPCTEFYISGDNTHLVNRCLLCKDYLWGAHVGSARYVESHDVEYAWEHMQNEHADMFSSQHVAWLFDDTYSSDDDESDVVCTNPEETIRVCWVDDDDDDNDDDDDDDE